MMDQIEYTTEEKKLIDDMVQRLPKIRKKLRFSQTEFGEKLGLSRQTISSIERGIVPLSWNNYLAILFLLTINNRKVFYYPKDNEQDTIGLLKKMLSVKEDKPE